MCILAWLQLLNVYLSTEMEAFRWQLSTWGDFPEKGWEGSVQTPDGKLVGIPYNSLQVVVVDPETRVVDLFGECGDGRRKWAGGAAMPDGLVVAFLFCASQVLPTDPVARTVELFGDVGHMEFTRFPMGNGFSRGSQWAMVFRWFFGVLTGSPCFSMVFTRNSSTLVLQY